MITGLHKIEHYLHVQRLQKIAMIHLLSDLFTTNLRLNHIVTMNRFIGHNIDLHFRTP